MIKIYLQWWPVRLALGLVIAVVAWNLLAIPAVANPVLAFWFAGVVPGSGVVLTPDSIIYGVLSLFGLAALVMLAIWSVHRWRVIKAGKVLLTPATAIVVPKQATIKAAKRPRRPTSFGWLRSTGQWLKRKQISTGKHIDTFRMFSRKQLGKAGKQTGRAAVWTAVSLSILVESGIVYGRRGSICFWRWSKPHLQRFDSWLELHFRQLTANITTRLSRSQRWQVVQAIYRDCRRSIHNFFN